MMDILFAKGLGLTKKKKDNELKKLLKNIDGKRGREENVVWWLLICLHIFLITKTIVGNLYSKSCWIGFNIAEICVRSIITIFIFIPDAFWNNSFWQVRPKWQNCHCNHTIDLRPCGTHQELDLGDAGVGIGRLSLISPHLHPLRCRIILHPAKPIVAQVSKIEQLS